MLSRLIQARHICEAAKGVLQTPTHSRWYFQRILCCKTRYYWGSPKAP